MILDRLFQILIKEKVVKNSSSGLSVTGVNANKLTVHNYLNSYCLELFAV